MNHGKPMFRTAQKRVEDKVSLFVLGLGSFSFAAVLLTYEYIFNTILNMSFFLAAPVPSPKKAPAPAPAPAKTGRHLLGKLS